MFTVTPRLLIQAGREGVEQAAALKRVADDLEGISLYDVTGVKGDLESLASRVRGPVKRLHHNGEALEENARVFRAADTTAERASFATWAKLRNDWR